MKRPVFKASRFILLIIYAVLLSGCWDYRDLERRGYVLGIAIDKAFETPEVKKMEDSGGTERDIDRMPLQEGKHKYTFTIQVPIIARSQTQPSGQGGGGGGDGHRSWEIAFTGNSFFEVNREYATRLDYPAFYEHLQAIVISEDAARMGINEPLDMILRDPEMRRRTRLFVTPGKAHELFQVTPKIDDYSALYLMNLPQGAAKTSRMAHKTDLGQVSESLHAGMDFALPRVIYGKEEIKCSGLAVFKGDKMVGWLGEIDTIFVKWAANVALGGTITIPSPKPSTGILTLEVNNVKTQVRPVVKGDEITMRIRSKADVNIAEETSRKFVEVLDEEFFIDVKKEAESKVKSEMLDTLQYVQKEFGTDIFFFDLAMQRYAPDVWEKVKDDWHDIFSNLEFDIDVDIKMGHTGLLK